MLITILLLLIICPLLPVLPIAHWTMRFFDFVRVQTSVIQVAILIACFYFWSALGGFEQILVLFTFGVLTYQIILVIPYTLFFPKRKQQQEFHTEQLSLVTANVLQTNDCYHAFIERIQEVDPDIFITMESHKPWDIALSKAFPDYTHTLKATLDNFYGMHLYSKIPFKKQDIKYLVEDDIPSMHCTLEFANQIFNLIAVHPAPPSPTENKTSKERDAELMIIGKKCRASTDSTIVCGDLNDVIWSRSSKLFKKMTGFLDPRVGRGLYPSFHANIWLLRFPLDHLFYSKDLHVTTIKRLKSFGSDHFAMYYKIAFPLKDTEANIPEISKEESQEIKDIITSGMISARY